MSSNGKLAESLAGAMEVRDLHGGIAGQEIVKGVDLTIGAGQVHAVMGRNGSGKSTLSHLLMGRPGYEMTGGQVLLDGTDISGLPTFERARRGLFLALQYPIEVPGVSLLDMFGDPAVAAGRDRAELEELMVAEAARIGFDRRFLSRPLNVDLSGGEKKRNETLQLGVLRPRYAILDEIDSGLDIDALRVVARRIEAATEDFGLGVLAITHYSRLLGELGPDVVHVMDQGRIVDQGGPELAQELERTGYAAYGGEAAAPV